MSPPVALRLMLVLAVVASARAGTPAPVDPDSKTPAQLENAVSFDPASSHWSITGGYQWRQLGSLNFQTGSQAAHSSLPWMAKGGSNARASTSNSSFGDPNAPGSSTSTANRTYNDGYVNQDGGTAFFGDTWFWGYNNASQVQGNTLSYHNSSGTISATSPGSSTSSSQSSSLRNDLGWNSDLSGSGWFASLGSPALFTRGPVSVSMELGYSYASAGASHETANVFQAHQQTVQRSTPGTTTTTTNNLTDTYDVTGLVVPSAPYAGTLAGPGPLINNIPQSRSVSSSTTSSNSGGGGVTSVSTADFRSNVNESLDLKMNTVSIGPHVSWESQRLSLGLSSGLALNIADWDSTYREDLTVRQNGGAARLLTRYQHESSGLDVLPGVYVELNASLRLTKHVSLFAGARYDWAGTLHGDVGPSSFAFKVSGWSALGGVTILF